MGKIRLLDSNTIDQIAAGEVVERPLSVVKELVENSMDAGADAITVEIRDGGIEFIRVTDNGSGIDADDMALAFERHATSKIRSIEDLSDLHSMGFRGEALASISSVSRVTLISAKKGELMGHRFESDGGVAGELTEVGAPQGTTVIVAHLFYNVPVRRKFLKSPVTEGNAVGELMEHLALSRPDISFKFVNNGRTVFFTNGAGELKDVIYRIYGREMAREVVPVSYEKDGIRIDGYLGTPSINRPNRNFENYFLNERYIKSDVIAGGLEDGYQGYTMKHKFPFCVISINVPADSIDVNVHPSKMDVRFKDRESFFAAVSEAVHNALHAQEMIPEADLSGERKSIRPVVDSAPEPYEIKRRKDEETADSAESAENSANDKAVGYSDEKISIDKSSTDKSSKVNGSADIESSNTAAVNKDSENKESKNAEIFSVDFSEDVPVLKDEKKTERESPPAVPSFEVRRSIEDVKPGKQIEMLPKERVISKNARGRYELIGQVFNCYWIFVYEDRLYFADQHACHEKVNYEHFIKAYKEHEVYKQQVDPPVVVTLSNEEEEIFLRFKDYLDELGFEADSFGGKEYALHTVPLDLYRKDAGTLFLDILNDIRQRGIKATPDMIEKVIASMACKASVKAGDRIQREQMDTILDELLTLDNPYHCPHGRPTVFSVDRYELEKRFKRVVS